MQHYGSLSPQQTRPCGRQLRCSERSAQDKHWFSKLSADKSIEEVVLLNLHRSSGEKR